MPLKLYCAPPSPPVRATFLCCAALGLQPELKIVDILNKEQHTPEYLKINPQHCVPTIDDDGFQIWDSHAICCYLVSKYGKDDSLYPKDLKKRALVDQRLHFDSGILFPRLRDITTPLIFYKCKEIPEEKRKRVLEAYDLLEKFLEGTDYLAGNNFTVADFCCVATVSTLNGPLRIPVDGHPKVKAWFERCKTTLPGYDKAQTQGLQMFKSVVDAELA